MSLMSDLLGLKVSSLVSPPTKQTLSLSYCSKNLQEETILHVQFVVIFIPPFIHISLQYQDCTQLLLSVKKKLAEAICNGGERSLCQLHPRSKVKTLVKR